MMFTVQCKTMMVYTLILYWDAYRTYIHIRCRNSYCRLDEFGHSTLVDGNGS